MMNYSDFTTEQITTALNNDRLLIPVGAIEQHGPHLPLSVDIDITTAIAMKLSDLGSGIVAPGIVYGARSQPHSGGGPSFPGTIYVRGTVLIDYFVDVLKSFAVAGAKQLVLINGHYENEPFLFEALEICRETGYLSKTSIIAFSWWSVIAQNIIDELFGEDFPGWHAEHASIIETSLMMHIKPHLVKEMRLNHTRPPLAGIYLHPIDPSAISSRGVLANTQKASEATGQKLFLHICSQIEALLKKPHGMLNE
ncbi:MAG: creatininase family protein [Chlamydiota bacterium]